MQEILLDIASFEDKIPLHRYLKEQMGFPFYYGGNLDALHVFGDAAQENYNLKLTVRAVD